jgi:hypothetical protein
MTAHLDTRTVRGVVWLAGGQRLRQRIGFIVTMTLTSSNLGHNENEPTRPTRPLL